MSFTSSGVLDPASCCEASKALRRELNLDFLSYVRLLLGATPGRSQDMCLDQQCSHLPELIYGYRRWRWHGVLIWGSIKHSFFFYQTISFECSEVAVNTEHPGNTYVLILEKSVPCVWAQLSIYCRKPVSKVHWKYMKISIFPSLDME